MGLVLRKTTEGVKRRTTEELRSMTTNLSTTIALECFETVRREHGQILSRRKEVLKRLGYDTTKVDDVDETCWGRGLLIFAPSVNTKAARGGLKQRYLPHITATTPDPPATKKSGIRYLLDKQGCSNRVVTGVRAWIEYRRVRAHQRNSVTSPSLAPRLLMSVGIERAERPDHNYISVEALWALLVESDPSLKRSKKSASCRSGIDAAAAFGLITFAAKGSSRKRSVVFAEIFRR